MVQYSVRLATALTVIVSLAGCAEQAVEPAPVVRPIKMRTIGAADSAAFREYPGTIKAWRDARPGFEVSGRIIESEVQEGDSFEVQEGDWVEKGQVLARLDPRDYENERQVALANHKKAEADLKRSENIKSMNPGAIAVADIERDERAVEVTKAHLAIADKAVEDTKLIAAFDGLMARKLVADFANIQAKEPVLILQDISRLKIEISVPERDVAHLPALGTQVDELTDVVDPKLIVSALPDWEFSAQIWEFATTAEPVTRTFAVTLVFDRPEDVNILPGMTARVSMVIDPELAWAVPVTAVQSDEKTGQPYVWKVDPETMTVKRTGVEVGQLTGDRVQLTGGVAAGEMIAISGVTQLREGMKVHELQTLSGE